MLANYLIALIAHWVADFPVQGALHRWMGKKATSLLHLFNHIGTYALAFFVVFVALSRGHDTAWLYGGADPSLVFEWVLLNALLHGVIDFWTSKGTAACWTRAVYPRVEFQSDGCVRAEVCIRQRFAGPFFSIIGFDQLMHVAFLLWSGYAIGVL